MYAKLSPDLRKAIYRRDGFQCAVCGSTRYLQIHHYIHRGQGGNDSPHNLITLCSDCHALAHGINLVGHVDLSTSLNTWKTCTLRTGIRGDGESPSLTRSGRGGGSPSAGRVQVVSGRGRPACAPPAAAAVRACAGWVLVCRWVLVSAPALEAAPWCGRGARSGRPCWKGEGGRPPLVSWSAPSPTWGTAQSGEGATPSCGHEGR